MINADRIVKNFIKLTEFDSESGHEQEICKYLLQKLQELGLSTEIDEVGNIYGILPGDDSIAPVLFSAHQDTVAPGIGKKAIVHEDGTITSDGNTVLGSDDISGIVSILEMFEVIKEDKLKHGDIEVVFSVSEETFCQGIKKFDFSKIKSKRAYTLDLSGAIGTAAVAAPSILTINIDIHGKAAHSGFAPEQGIHSIKIAAAAIYGIENGRIDEETTVNFGIISGGTAPNIVPESVKVSGEVRSMNHEKALEQANGIISIFESKAKEYGGSISSDIIVNIKAYRTDEHSDTVLAYKKACERLGIETVITDTFGGSDNNVFANNGIEGIVISCGMNNVHTKDEFTTVSQLVDSSRAVVELVTQK